MVGDSPVPENGRSEARVGARGVLYALSGLSAGLDDHVLHALEALRPHAHRLVVAHPGALDDISRSRLAAVADDVVQADGDVFSTNVYATAMDRSGILNAGIDELVLTGDAWFGPVRDLTPVLARMDGVDADFWEMIENYPHLPEAFPEEGFGHVLAPWRWTAVRSSLFRRPEWAQYWSEQRPHPEQLLQERTFRQRLTQLGFTGAAAFAAADYPSDDPALFSVEDLLDDGCPFVDRLVFASYPPFLDRFAIIGREIAATIESYGYPVALMWQHLARTVAPKALNTNAGMLEILPDASSTYDQARPFRIAAIVHATELSGVDEILKRLELIPTPIDLFVTTTEGMSAAKLEPLLESWANLHHHTYELRVTPASPGRDMSDFFVGCRDVLMSDRYDLVFKLHTRPAHEKTLNLRRYFRRYQLDNLLNSAGYVENLLGLFQAEPGLGVVFPPMMHIGYSIAGRGWGYVHEPAERVRRSLGISVPLDAVSPLAPYGGMWVARPAALRLLVQRGWSFGDYGKKGERRYRSLARIQERLVPLAAAELGYHSRTVLTFEHASISHTALDFKVDQLFSTTRGWPVEQIRLLHRAGYTGYGGTVALARMYLRLNRPEVVRALRPLYRVSYRAYGVYAAVRRVAGRVRGDGDQGEGTAS